MHSINDAAAVLRNPCFHTATIKPLRADLDRTVKTIAELYAAQNNAALELRGDGLSVAALKLQLRKKHLLPISRRAKLLLKGYPGIEESVRVPHKRGSVQMHVDATKRMTKALRPHVREFVAVGLSKSFLVDCERAARVLKETRCESRHRAKPPIPRHSEPPRRAARRAGHHRIHRRPRERGTRRRQFDTGSVARREARTGTNGTATQVSTKAGGIATDQ